MSILEKKIRKKILLINADPRSMMKKLKDIDILRRFMLYHRKPKRPTQIYQPRQQGQPLVQEVVEMQPEPLPIEQPIENLPVQEKRVDEEEGEVGEVADAQLQEVSPPKEEEAEPIEAEADEEAREVPIKAV